MSHTPIKRYEPEVTGHALDSGPMPFMAEDEIGDYVRYEDYDRLTAEVGMLREALETAIDWIRNAPEDTWGEGSNSEGMRWPIRDELADKLCKALNPEEPK